jgi:hypothetical protein
MWSWFARITGRHPSEPTGEPGIVPEVEPWQGHQLFRQAPLEFRRASCIKRIATARSTSRKWGWDRRGPGGSPESNDPEAVRNAVSGSCCFRALTGRFFSLAPGECGEAGQGSICDRNRCPTRRLRRCCDPGHWRGTAVAVNKPDGNTGTRPFREMRTWGSAGVLRSPSGRCSSDRFSDHRSPIGPPPHSRLRWFTPHRLPPTEDGIGPSDRHNWASGSCGPEAPSRVTSACSVLTSSR